MSLQTQRLVMIGLESFGDIPPDGLQPPLRNGVHLRWAFPRELGFPWFGFYLFRRPHGGAEPTCISGVISNLQTGPWPSSSLSIPYGVFSSDHNIVLTNNFAPSSRIEFDLQDRQRLLFTLAPNRISRIADVKIGFRELAQIRVIARFGNGIVAEATISGSAGDIIAARLEADAIDSIELSGGAAAMIDLCFEPVDRGATFGWHTLEASPYPFALPVQHPDYPAQVGAPDLVASRATALARITYGASSDWAAAFPELHETLLFLVTDGPTGPAMADKLNPHTIGTPAGADGPIPHLSNTRALDLVLLATLNRAVADMIGLSFLDETADPSQRYDYLIVASHNSVGAGSGSNMLNEITANGFANVDAWIVFNKTAQASPPLRPPSGLRNYSLPGTTLATQGTSITDATNNAGLRWSLPKSGGILLPDRPVTYLVWRADCGNGNAPMMAPFDVATKTPILVAEHALSTGVTPQRAMDWPPFPLHFIDIGLAEGWYAYQVTGIDIFGRHSRQSDSGDWYQWVPEPAPLPWYYIDPPASRIVYVGAVRLLDKTPPPPPTAIEAFALDPADPTVLNDSTYQAWFNALSAAEKQSLVGLRVRWQWTAALSRQAPDAAEFRIYYQPGRPNALLGDITAVAVANAFESEVTTNISNIAPSDAFVGASLRVGALSFAIVGSGDTSPLKVRVVNRGLTVTAGSVSVTNGTAEVVGLGTAWHAGMNGLHFRVAGSPHTYTIFSVDSATRLRLSTVFAGVTAAAQSYTVFDVEPPASGPATIVIPEHYATGSVALTRGLATVVGSGTQWSAALTGMRFKLQADAGIYRIVAVDATTQQLTLDRRYDGATAAKLAYAISFPLFTDYRKATNWDYRFYVVDFSEHVQLAVDGAGLPLRKYEVIIPVVGDTIRNGAPLVTSLAEPVVYAQVSVSTADARQHSLDAPKWAMSPFGNRSGNEGDVGSMATIFRVRREPPPQPATPAMQSGYSRRRPTITVNRSTPSAGCRRRI